LQDGFEKNKQPREQQFFGGEFSPLGNQKKNPVHLIKRTFSEKNAPKSQFLKLPYLDNRFQQVAKLLQDS
jgi:hypothetical protein